VNFTREPIIETVITPREGCKLVVRSSKGANQEDYFVDAVEVVSFGHSFFFRSLERPKSFLVPVSDYEILELKETRMVLKNVSGERSIKIGGGRDTPPRPQAREQAPAEEVPRSEIAAEAPSNAPMQDRKGRDRRRSRRRRGGGSMDMRHEGPVSEERPESQPNQPPTEGVERSGEELPPPSFISKLFPPPSTLIKDNLSRYKTSEEGTFLKDVPSIPEDIIEQPPVEPKPKADEETKFED